MKALPAALLNLTMLAAPVAEAGADLIETINEIRRQGCADLPGVLPALRHDPRLDRVAQALASGRNLREAMMDAGYRAVQTATLELSGSSEAAHARKLAESGCEDIVNPPYRDVGVELRGDAAWIVLAVPQVPPKASDAQAVSRRMLELVNEARARPRRCGWKRFDAAPALVLSEMLQRAALAHARDMASRSSLRHAGHDGSTPAERATRAGYRWRVTGENIAAGQATPEQVVAEWLGSPNHCANLMDKDFSEMGVAFAVEPASKSGIYWSQLFAAPRR